MKRGGIATLKLHGGAAPWWLLKRMKPLAKYIFMVIADEFGSDVILKRLADPVWFQALAMVLGFDWNSSGTTTTTCGVLKSVLNFEEHGVQICGGKGGRSRKTPSELMELNNSELFKGNPDSLIYASKMTAKIDNTAIQDGYQLYHHNMLVSTGGEWTVVQQGMNSKNSMSRRYHWHSKGLKSFVEEPPENIISEKRHKNVLDMTAKESNDCRSASLTLVNDSPNKIMKEYNLLTAYSKTSLLNWIRPTGEKVPVIHYKLLPRRMNWTAVKRIYEFQPTDYEELLSIKGVGPATVRGLSLVSELVYNAVPSWKDPVKFSFAFGGKDGVPYPVNRKAMDESIQVLRSAIQDAKLGQKDKLNAIKRLKKFTEKVNIL
ncbi:MAG: DUF763 domain-containing protein [Candidatus Helarchaeota archaeon]|nr:DUF763 domain-containing protein [Candidatus Helarchaeota archaeon]